jgi:hypothetical protein
MASRSPKEKVLHTRVPEALEAQIKALADALRVPVSSLVRNILEDSVAVIDSAANGLNQTLKSVTANVKNLSDRARADHQELRRGWTEFQSILGESFRTVPPSNGEGAHDKDDHGDASIRFPGVLGWQPISLNVGARCACCDRTMFVGETAHLGVRDQPGPRVLICHACVPRLGAREEGKL